MHQQVEDVFSKQVPTGHHPHAMAHAGTTLMQHTTGTALRRCAQLVPAEIEGVQIKHYRARCGNTRLILHS